MLRTIVQVTTAGAGSFNASLANCSLNGLVISKSVQFHANDRLTVSLSQRGVPPKTLIPSLPLTTLAGISDNEGGFSSLVQSAMNTLLALGDYTGFCCYVPLGTLRNMENDSTLELQVIAGDAAEWSIGACLHDVLATDEIFTYIQSNQAQGYISSCRELFLVTTTAMLDPASQDISFEVSGDFGSGVANANDLWARSAVLGEQEWLVNPVVLKAYADPYPDIPGDVTYQLTGANAGLFVIVARCSLMDRARVSRATIFSGQVMKKRLAKRDKDTGLAYVRAGRALKLDDLNRALVGANVKGAK